MSRSRLRDLGLLEPGPPKKVAAPQHWLTRHKQSGGLSPAVNCTNFLNEKYCFVVEKFAIFFNYCRIFFTFPTIEKFFSSPLINFHCCKGCNFFPVRPLNLFVLNLHLLYAYSILYVSLNLYLLFFKYTCLRRWRYLVPWAQPPALSHPPMQSCMSHPETWQMSATRYSSVLPISVQCTHRWADEKNRGKLNFNKYLLMGGGGE